ncbi:MAG: DUF134 domain-containing protein [Ruminococcus sp.]|nr:DUF134 domain-containing protein [uncultured Schaedlerella sp.]MCI8769290.1 DUF134 domain-containing protein [Ruminococcus sp.]
MARPSRCRRICIEPAYDSFAPEGISCGEQVNLTVDEYEVIRLIDLEKLTHEQCARQMDISRTTVTEAYEAAREKVADSIVHGKQLLIEGGNYRLCEGSAIHFCQRKCRKHCGKTDGTKQDVQMKGAGEMRIAVTFENGEVFQHFGHTEQFKIYDVADGQITKEQVIDTNGSGHGALSGLLGGMEVDTLICGGIGYGAQVALAEAGIRLYGGVTGNADDAVRAFLAGDLAYDPEVQCDHHGHGHEEGHCQGHCGENKHGCAGN